jgi:hypothetical protein
MSFENNVEAPIDEIDALCCKFDHCVDEINHLNKYGFQILVPSYELAVAYYPAEDGMSVNTMKYSRAHPFNQLYG